MGSTTQTTSWPAAPCTPPVTRSSSRSNTRRKSTPGTHHLIAAALRAVPGAQRQRSEWAHHGFVCLLAVGLLENGSRGSNAHQLCNSCFSVAFSPLRSGECNPQVSVGPLTPVGLCSASYSRQATQGRRERAVVRQQRIPV